MDRITTLMACIMPFLPVLAKLGEPTSEKATESAMEKAIETFGEEAWRKAKAVWARLQPRVEAKAAAKEAAIDAAHDPEDEDVQAALRVQLKKLLQQDEGLAADIAKILAADEAPRAAGTQIQQQVRGNQNQVIGQVAGGQVFGNITGNVVIGNSNSPMGAPPAQAEATPKNPATSVKTILVLTANPVGTSPLRLGEEVRKIQAGLERSHYRDRFRIEQRWAVTPRDVQRALLDCQPQIIHFSGHGSGTEQFYDPTVTRKLELVSSTKTGAGSQTESGSTAEPEGLVFEDDTGTIKLVSSQAIANLFALFADQVECVVLNACYSVTQAEAIAAHIPYVVGMKRAIGDRAAIEFAVGFYDALLAGRSIEFAYKLGCNAVQLAGIPEHLTPVLKHQSG